MTQLKQVQLQYHSAADRLVLRIAGDGGAEYRVWLTRRAVKVLWPKLVECLRKNPTVSVQETPTAKEAVLSFRHQEAVAKADFDTGYQEREDRSYPLGEEPILAVKIRLAPTDRGAHLLSLYPQRGRGIDMTLSEQLLHAFCKLLADTATKAEWDLELLLTKGEESAASEAVIH